MIFFSIINNCYIFAAEIKQIWCLIRPPKPHQRSYN
nr:MAG TPA: hypothetical protein [Caudoviricetes sp.]